LIRAKRVPINATWVERKDNKEKEKRIKSVGSGATAAFSYVKRNHLLGRHKCHPK
jgi:hypothetical protein